MRPEEALLTAWILATSVVAAQPEEPPAPAETPQLTLDSAGAGASESAEDPVEAPYPEASSEQDPFHEAEAVRFDLVDAPPPRAEGVEGGSVPRTPADRLWTLGKRDALFGIVSMETELHRLGRDPGQVEVVSAELDWGTAVTGPYQRRRGTVTQATTFSRSAVTVRRERLADGALVDEAKKVDLDGEYVLGDPEEAARLCARLRASEAGTEASGQPLQLHTWSDRRGEVGPNDLSRRDASFYVAEGDEERTAMIELAPGESATVVELVDDGRHRRRVRRKLEVRRGERTVSMTEGDLLRRVCLEY